MPGFMSSIKSHLPQSPFSPNKKSASATTPTEVATPTEEGAVAEEVASAEVLPGETLVQQTSSTVALTLTPANGESSQQLSVDDAEVASSAQPITQSDSPAEPESAVADSAAVESTEVHSETVEAEVTQPTVEEGTAEAPQPEAAVVETAAVVPTPVLEADAAPAPEASHEEAGQPQDGGSAQQVAEETGAPADEPAVSTEASNDVPSTPTEAESTKPAKVGFSTHVKRNKSKKSKTDSPETSDVGESGAGKPRKSHPLAGKFRSVIDQVMSKVKKDKDGLVKEGPLTPSAVAVIEPTPVCEEPAAAA